MGSLKRLQHINKIVAGFYPDLTISNSSTLVMNYIEAIDLQSVDLPNINYESKLKHQVGVAKRIGLVTSLKINKTYEIVIVSVSKSKDQSFAQIAVGYERTKSGGVLIVEGNKNNGVDAIIHKLSKILALEHIIAKAHGKIAIFKISSKNLTGFEEWLAFDTPYKNEDGFYSIPGLFSHKKPDAASQFLSNLFDNRIYGDVIDLGAGWGFLSAKLLDKSLNLKSLTLMDHDQRAIECARKNIKSPKAIFKWLDIKEINEFDSKFDNVVCNPPFHSANGINIELGKTFIKTAHSILKRTGSLLMVANIQLPYENLIDTLFKDFIITAQNKYFKIILAKGPKK
jgi:16S rRNA (guanine1207-N2)-methyltransferase